MVSTSTNSRASPSESNALTLFKHHHNRSKSYSLCDNPFRDLWLACCGNPSVGPSWFDVAYISLLPEGFSSMPDLVTRLLQETSPDRTAAGLVFNAVYQPVGGGGGTIHPPTFPGEEKYSVSERTVKVLEDGAPVKTLDVAVDQFQSQANRVEEALLDACRDGRVALPMFELTAETARGRTVLTSLDFPHRYADAYLRDSQINGVKFDQTEHGRALRAVSDGDVRALFVREPYSLLFGAWDSHRKGRKQKLPRLYKSEMTGRDWEPDARFAGRYDPLNLNGIARRSDGEWEFAEPDGKKVKGERLSELGHGHIAPGAQPGGGRVSRIDRRAWVSLSGLARLRFGDAGVEAAHLARTTLLALALAGDRLVFGAPSLWLRSGCDLTLAEEQIGFEGRGGAIEPLEVSASEALAAFETLRERAAAAGLAMAADTVAIEPQAPLAKAIAYAIDQSSSSQE